MIIIKKILNKLKIFGIFILIEVLVAFIMGLFNLIGLNISLSKIIILIINVLVFFGYGFVHGKNTNRKGLLEGLITGLSLIAILFLISIIFFHSSLSIVTLFYYLALLMISTIGSTIGKNKKEDSTLSEKK